MLKVYCYSRCTTCKKALKWLDDHGIAYTAADIKSEHPDEETLRRYYAVSGLPLKRFFNTCGWPTAEEHNHETDKTSVVVTFEKRRQEDELPVPKFLYHLTPENKVGKILKNGLAPKAQNKLGEHPDRIYFFSQKDLTLNYKSYADDFWASAHKDTRRDIKYSLLKIDTEKCRNDFKIYGDPNMIRGVWTFNNVPPEAITVEEEGI